MLFSLLRHSGARGRAAGAHGVGGGWVQADLGAVYDITAIGYCPRSGYEYRCPDGMFMVSEDGENWTTVYTITGKPSFGMHYVRPKGAATGRYVRYQVPDGTPNNGYNSDDVYCCNIAEIELYGNLIGALQGDVNADGTVSLADAVMLQKYLLTQSSTVSDASAADLDADGKLTARDLTRLKQLLLK